MITHHKTQLYCFCFVHDDWDSTRWIFSVTCENVTNNDGGISIIATRDAMFVTTKHIRCLVVDKWNLKLEIGK